MAKIRYFAKENSKVGTHSFYAVPALNGTLTFEELVEEAASKTTYEKSVVRACIEEYINAVKVNTLKGFRCPLGQNFLTVYPNISASVKDTKDEKTGEITVATAKMLTAANAKSRLGCTVHSKFSKQFADEVSWQKIDAQTGATIDEEDITQDNENVNNGEDNTQNNTPSTNNGGSTSTGENGEP